MSKAWGEKPLISSTTTILWLFNLACFQQTYILDADPKQCGFEAGPQVYFYWWVVAVSSTMNVKYDLFAPEYFFK